MNKKENILKRLQEFIPLSFVFVICIASIKAVCPDPDTYFLAATGREIVKNGIVTKINPFVIHENYSIIIQQWLFDLLVYYIYDNLGVLGIYLYSCSIFVVISLLMYKFFNLYSDNKNIKMICLFIAMKMSTIICVSRPTSISFIIFILTIIIIETYKKNNNLKLLLWLPILSLIEINIHAAMWPMLFIIILPLILPNKIPNKEQFKEHLKQNKYIIFSMISMFIMGFANPNGISGMFYLVLSYKSAASQNFIIELKPPEVFSFYGTLIIFSVITLTVYIYKNKEKIDIQKTCMAIGTLLLAVKHCRNFWFLMIGIFPILLINCKDITITKKEKTIKRYITENCICYTFIVLLAALFLIGTNYNDQDIEYGPVKAVEYLDDYKKEEIKLYTDFNNGAYMEWHGYKTYIDARPEIYQKKINKKENLYDEYLGIYVGDIEYDNFIEKYNFTHMIIKKNSVLETYMKYGQNDYVTVVDGNGYYLYEKIDFQKSGEK